MKRFKLNKKLLLSFLVAVIVVTGLVMNQNRTKVLEENDGKTSKVQYSEEEIKKVKDFEATLQKCGDLPDIKEQVTTTTNKQYIAESVWSPDCKYIAWSQIRKELAVGWYEDNPKPTQTKKTVFKPEKWEGVFIFDMESKKSTRAHEPKSEDEIKNIEWIDGQNISFDVGNSKFTYSLTK